MKRKKTIRYIYFLRDGEDLEPPILNTSRSQNHYNQTIMCKKIFRGKNQKQLHESEDVIFTIVKLIDQKRQFTVFTIVKLIKKLEQRWKALPVLIEGQREDSGTNFLTPFHFSEE